MTFEGAFQRAKELIAVNIMVTLIHTNRSWQVNYKF